MINIAVPQAAFNRGYRGGSFITRNLHITSFTS
jgi:hypothetical protein